MKAIRGGWFWAAALIGALFIFTGTEIVSYLAVLSWAPNSFATSSEAAMLSTLIAQLVLAGIGALWYRSLRLSRQRRAIDYGTGRLVGPPQYALSKRPLRKRLTAHVILTLLLIGVTLQILVSSILSLIEPLLPDLMNSYDQTISEITDSSWFSVVSLCIMAPLCEEFYFRGVCMQLGQRIHPDIRVALVGQGLVFAIAHGNLVQGSYAFFLGLILGVVSLSQGGLLASMFLHFAVNTSSYSVGILLGAISGLGWVGYLVSALIAALITVYLLRSYLRQCPSVQGAKKTHGSTGK